MDSSLAGKWTGTVLLAALFIGTAFCYEVGTETNNGKLAWRRVRIVPVWSDWHPCDTRSWATPLEWVAPMYSVKKYQRWYFYGLFSDDYEGRLITPGQAVKPES